jgi:hypothetical protein
MEDAINPDDKLPPSASTPIVGMEPVKRKRGRPPKAPDPRTDDEVRAVIRQFHLDVVRGKRPAGDHAQQTSARYLADELAGRVPEPITAPAPDAAAVRKALAEEMRAQVLRERPAVTIAAGSDVVDVEAPGPKVDPIDGGVVTSVTDMARIRQFDLQHELRGIPKHDSGRIELEAGYYAVKDIQTGSNRVVYRCYNSEHQDCGVRSSPERVRQWFYENTAAGQQLKKSDE